MRHMNRSFAGWLLCVLALLLAACQGLGGEPRIVATVAPAALQEAISPAGRSAEVVALGAQVWADECALCHGPTGQGAETAEGAPLPDLSALSDERIVSSISDGVGDTMPAFRDALTFDQLQAVMTYARMVSVAHARDAANAPADAATVPGVVSGRVTNGTAGAPLPDGLALTLHVLKSEFSEQTFGTAVNADGSYRIADVPMNHAYRYVVTAPHGDTRFVSAMLQGSVGATALELPLTIYEGGATPADIQVTEIGMQVIVRGDEMQIAQMVAFGNNSDRVYLTPRESGATSVGLRVPVNAQVQDHSGEGYLVSDDGEQIFDTRPLLPGEVRPMYVLYSLPYAERSAFEQPFDYRVQGNVRVQLVNDGLSLVSEGLSPVQVDSGGTMLAGDLDRPAGSTIGFEAGGIPASAQAAVPAADNSLGYLLIGAGVGALIIALLMTARDLRQSRSRRATPDGDLIEQLAALDREHDAGHLSRRDYERRRAELKTRLSRQMKASKAQ